MQFDVTQVFLGIIAVLGAIVTHVLIPWVKAKIAVEKQKELWAWARIAVQAAEQIYAGSGRGEEKKAYVTEWLKERGVTFDADVIEAQIEAMVREIEENAAMKTKNT
jgi:hypothetical protein